MDARAATAPYYDLEPEFPADIPFYLRHLANPNATVLELGCGTGRVTAALAPRIRFILGIDLSPAMIGRCVEHLSRAQLPSDRATAQVGDITQIELNTRFDWIIAPYRVFQNLASDQEVENLFRVLHAHLAPGGHCILNTFRPYAEPAALIQKWQTVEEDLDWERSNAGDIVQCHVRRGRVQSQPLVLFPELIYRRYRGQVLIEEARSSIAMRCWYPIELLDRIQKAGFRVTGTWGGYADEPYGTGTELVVAMTEP